MTLEGDIVIVTLPGKMINQYIPKIIEVYKQPQEVEDKLSFLLKEDDGKKPTVSYLSEKYRGLKP